MINYINNEVSFNKIRSFDNEDKYTFIIFTSFLF